MVAHDVLRVVDHTTAIAGEQATGMNGVEITPRVDTVAAWHGTSLSFAVTGTAGERRMIPNRSRSVEADGGRRIAHGARDPDDATLTGDAA
jgi:hypothetical protein